MLILAPILIMLLVASVLLVLHYFQPEFKYPWMVATGGAVLALIAVFAWQFHMPDSFALPSWQLQTISTYYPAWISDNASWIYSLSLAALALAVISTSVVRAESHPVTWAGDLLLCALGILAVAAGNPLTLVLAWTALDLAELVIMLRSTEGEEQSQSVVIAFAIRLLSTALVLWASTLSISSGTPLDFRATPARSGIYLLLAAGLRLGVLPLHLPYRQENVLRRGLGTTLRLVSAASSLALLAHIPPNGLGSPLLPVLLILAALAGLYAGWMWLRASDELVGRPFWILGMASLAVGASLRADPFGSIAWGFTLILSGCLLFLFSARQRSLVWLPFVAAWGLTALPFTPTATGWQTGNHSSWIYNLLLMPVQAFMLAGFVRHALHRGETSFESQARWTKIIYPTGLLLPAGLQILLGVWGWNGSRMIGIWLVALVAILLAGGLTVLSTNILVKGNPASGTGRWLEFFRFNWLYRIIRGLYVFLVQTAGLITSTLEGEGGILWSLVLLVLILSILFTWGPVKP